MKHGTRITAISISIMAVFVLLLFLPAMISNAILHYRLSKIHKGMTQEEAVRIVNKQPRPRGSGFEIAMGHRSSPLAHIFGSLRNNEFHVIRLQSNQVESVSTGRFFY